MKALKLTSNPDEKKQLKAQCGDMMNVADRIKNTETWTPPIAPQLSGARDERVGQWAAQVAGTATPGTAFEDSTTRSETSQYGLSSTTGPVDGQAASGKSSASSLSAFVCQSSLPSTVPFIRQDAHQSAMPLVNCPDDTFPAHVSSALTDVSREDSSNSHIHHDRHLPAPQTATLTPSAVPHSQIHRLREPISSRKLPPKESIILLKASIVNGFKFPPWDRAPSVDEFVSQEGVAPYTYIAQCLERSSSKILTTSGTLVT